MKKKKVFNFVCAHGNSTECSRREGNDGLAKQHVRICKNCDRWVNQKIGVRAGEKNVHCKGKNVSRRFSIFFSFLSPFVLTFELSLTGAHAPTPCVDVPIAGKKLTTSTHR